MTQNEFAREIGVYPSTVHRWERANQTIDIRFQGRIVELADKKHIDLRGVDALIATAFLFGQSDEQTSQHGERVSIYAESIAQHLQPNNRRLAAIVCMAGILHDIGKVTVSRHVKDKPGKLDAAEKAEMGTHVLHGEELIRKITQDEDVTRAAMEHQERLDGTGYPKQLLAKQISEAGQILAVADVFDALTDTKRPYRTIHYSDDEAIALMHDDAGLKCPFGKRA